MPTKSSPNNKTDSLSLLLQYCKPINEWPDHWSVKYTDIPIGQGINEYFKLFLIDRIDKNRAKSTIKIYARFLCALGGELIRLVNDGSCETLSTKEFILKHVSDEGGPYWRHARDVYEQARYNSVCKQLSKFISDHAID
jgi:hypothetical protein